MSRLVGCLSELGPVVQRHGHAAAQPLSNGAVFAEGGASLCPARKHTPEQKCTRLGGLALGSVLLGSVLAFLAITMASLSAYSPAADGLVLREADSSQSCEDGQQASGARYRICMPTPWYGDLVVYAHGYVAHNAPVAIPEEQLVLGGVSVPEMVTSLGYAFVTTSYYTNGLAVRQGIADLIDLVHVFTTTQEMTPTRVYLGGVSEGGLITTLAVEQYPDVFDGGLAVCGPVGSFRDQVDYFGDFRVVFDYFFPGLMPGKPVTIPQSLIDTWDSYYATVISPAITSPTSAYSLTQLLRVTNAAYEPGDMATMITTTEGLLWYNVFATNDGKAKLGGQPFDNDTRVYTGSDNDALLNQGVQRLRADQAALDEMQAHYQTTGWLTTPLVTLHTTLDEIVPHWHQALYRDKVAANNRTPWYKGISVSGYGHCNLEPAEVVRAFVLLVDRVTNQYPDLSTCLKSVADTSGDGIAQAGETLTYTITLTNSGTNDAGVVLTDALSSGLEYVPGSLTYGFPGTGFTATFSGNVLMAYTQGHLSPPEGSSLGPANTATITFAARVEDPLPAGTHIVNTVELRDQNRSYTIPPTAIRTRYQVLLPVVFRNR